ncbi:MAG: hypothetical protein ACI9ON_000281 [Limisphaerales bacterium]|jgi:hypothetical protein
MSRYSAFAIHLAISFLIFLALAYLIVFEWYPGILFDADGGWRGMRIIIGVDLVLGPTLTLVAYKHGKPGLKFDLACIALLQTVCLTAGTYVVWSERPLAVVYVDSRFEVLTADDFPEGAPDFSHYLDEGPPWLAVNIAANVEEEAEFRQAAFKAGRSLATMSDLYIPFTSKSPAFINDPRDISTIIGRDQGQAGLDQWLATHGGSVEDYSFYTFSTRYVYRYMGYRKETGENLGFLEVQPR